MKRDLIPFKVSLRGRLQKGKGKGVIEDARPRASEFKDTFEGK